MFIKIKKVEIMLCQIPVSIDVVLVVNKCVPSQSCDFLEYSKKTKILLFFCFLLLQAATMIL